MSANFTIMGMCHDSMQGTPPWLRQVELYLEDMGKTGLASAYAMARRRPEEYRRKVDAATPCSGVYPPAPDLTSVGIIRKIVATYSSRDRYKK